MCDTLVALPAVTQDHSTLFAKSADCEINEVNTLVRIVAGSTVDNFHAGGIAAAVDIATGRLGPATDLGLSPSSRWFAAHPLTGAAIEGLLLPFWHEARDLVEGAHAHFDDFAVIGWDSTSWIEASSSW